MRNALITVFLFTVLFWGCVYTFGGISGIAYTGAILLTINLTIWLRERKSWQH